jgi:hypothetical protein
MMLSTLYRFLLPIQVFSYAGWCECSSVVEHLLCICNSQNSTKQQQKIFLWVSVQIFCLCSNWVVTLFLSCKNSLSNLDTSFFLRHKYKILLNGIFWEAEVFDFVVVVAVLGFELWAYTLNYSTTPLLMMDFFSG